MFSPMAQGTIRPWSERGFFIGMEALFGIDSLPFRLVVFATAVADLLLITWLTRRITGSRIAGFFASVLWASNTALVRAMTWNSAYNEVMCPLFLMGALVLFILYSETRRAVFWWLQLVVFLLGFGALEINVVYPAIAAAWIVFIGPRERRKSLLMSVLPLVAVSVAYFAIHKLLAPLPAAGAYVLRFDTSLFKTMALYWKWSLTPEPMLRFGYRHFSSVLVFLIGSVAIAACVVTELRHRRFAVLFFLSWYLITLAPVLPLPEHRTDYYVTIPVIGLAMLAGAAIGRYWSGSFPQRVLIAIPVFAYLSAMVPVSTAVAHWWFERSLEVRGLMLGVLAARSTHPGKTIVVDGVTTQLFNLSLGNSSLAALGANDVYLTPESALNIKPDPDMADLDTLVLDPLVMQHAVTHDEVVVYSFENDHLRNITEKAATKRYRQSSGPMADGLPSRIDVGNSLYSWLLGPEWLSPESGVRWMPGRATLRLGVPPEGATVLELNGYCPETQLLQAPRHLMVLIDGELAADTRIYDPESQFHRLLAVTDALAGKTVANLEIRVDPVDRKDGQYYGLVFGKIALRH
jgi:hypothetical protein